MGAKAGGGNGSKKSGGTSIPDSALVSVTVTAKVARALLVALTAGNLPSQADAKAVALALVRALNTGGGVRKGKKGTSLTTAGGKKWAGGKMAGGARAKNPGRAVKP
jgi:hypothetical protein